MPKPKQTVFRRISKDFKYLALHQQNVWPKLAGSTMTVSQLSAHPYLSTFVIALAKSGGVFFLLCVFLAYLSIAAQFVDNMDFKIQNVKTGNFFSSKLLSLFSVLSILLELSWLRIIKIKKSVFRSFFEN